MKPLLPPNVPGKAEFERFDNAMHQILSVSKADLLKMEAREKRRKNAKGRNVARQADLRIKKRYIEKPLNQIGFCKRTGLSPAFMS